MWMEMSRGASCCLLLPPPVGPHCSPVCALWLLTPCVSETLRTASLFPRYKPWCFTVHNTKFCGLLADSLRQKQKNISRKGPWIQVSLSVFYPHYWAAGTLCSFAFCFFKSTLVTTGVKSDSVADPMPSQRFRYSLGQEEVQSELIQVEEDSNLCLPLSGCLLWPPASSITFSLNMRNAGVICMQQKGEQNFVLDLRLPCAPWERGLNLFYSRPGVSKSQTEMLPSHSLQRSLWWPAQVCNPEAGGQGCYLVLSLSCDQVHHLNIPFSFCKTGLAMIPHPRGMAQYEIWDVWVWWGEFCFLNAIYFVYREAFSKNITLYLTPPPQ